MFEIGSSLREARTRQGLTFEEMEARTKVRAKYLRHLEEERFDQLPGHTYTKGFLRVYADSLGLDGGLYVDEYNSRFVGLEDELQPRLPRSRPASTRRDRRDRRESRTVALALAGILGVTALVFAAWRFGGPDDPQVQGLNGKPTATLAGPKSMTITVAATKGPSFVEVRTGSQLGRPLFIGTLQQGRKQTFKAKQLYITVGKPANVVIKRDGAWVVPRRELRFEAKTSTS